MKKAIVVLTIVVVGVLVGDYAIGYWKWIHARKQSAVELCKKAMNDLFPDLDPKAIYSRATEQYQSTNTLASVAHDLERGTASLGTYQGHALEAWELGATTTSQHARVVFTVDFENGRARFDFLLVPQDRTHWSINNVYLHLPSGNGQ